MPLEVGADGVIGEQSPGHRRGDPELIGAPTQLAGAARGGHDTYQWGQHDGGCDENNKYIHGRKYLHNKILPTVAELTI